jgi:hypothetical protein
LESLVDEQGYEPQERPDIVIVRQRARAWFSSHRHIMATAASFDGDDGYVPGASSEHLKHLVIRATSSTNGEGDPAAVVEIQELLASTPDMLPDAVYYIKCRIKVQGHPANSSPDPQVVMPTNNSCLFRAG